MLGGEEKKEEEEDKGVGFLALDSEKKSDGDHFMSPHLLLRHAANSKGCDAPVAGLSSLAPGSAVMNAKVLSASFYG